MESLANQGGLPMYSAKRAQIRFERSNPRQESENISSYNYNTNQSESVNNNRVLMNSVIDNKEESEFDKNKRLR